MSIVYTTDGSPRFLRISTAQLAIVGTTNAEIGEIDPVAFGLTSVSVAVVNASETDTDILYVSYDAGVSWYPLIAGEAVDDAIELDGVQVKGSAASVAYKMRGRY